MGRVSYIIHRLLTKNTHGLLELNTFPYAVPCSLPLQHTAQGPQSLNFSISILPCLQIYAGYQAEESFDVQPIEHVYELYEDL